MDRTKEKQHRKVGSHEGACDPVGRLSLGPSPAHLGLSLTTEMRSIGENASHIVDPKRREEHLERVLSVGIDTTFLQESGLLCYP
jgi:hypothetical protein